MKKNVRWEIFNNFLSFFILSLFFSLVLLPKTAMAAFVGGTGTIADPYQISTCQQLQEAGSFLTSNYILINDIDCSDTINWNGGLGFIPIGTSSTNKFSGSFSGNGYKVSNLFIYRTSTDYIGLFGYTSATSTISRLGVVSSTITGHNYVGGLIGYSSGTTTQSYAIANVYGPYDDATVYYQVGGLIGNNRGKIDNSYSRGFLRTKGYSSYGSYAGGLVGNNGGNITNSFAAVVLDTPTVAAAGLMGRYEGGTISNSFWDISVSGKTTSGGGHGSGTTTLALRSSSTFSSWGFATSTTWSMSDDKNNGYPYLINNDPGSDPIIEINSISGLQAIVSNPGGRFTQTANIDATSTSNWNNGEGFIPIDYFYGQYDGNGYTISNLYINSSTEDYVGIFRQNRGTIRTMTLIDSSFTGNDYVGSIAAYNWGVISKSSFYRVNGPVNQVTGHNYVGGLVGGSNAVSAISESYAIANVYGPYDDATVYYQVGGLIGNNLGKIDNSYSRGFLRTKGYASYGSYAGGLVGNNGGNITNSFAAVVLDTPTVASAGLMGRYGGGTITNSFWDISVSGKTTSAGNKGTGTSTIPMKTFSTFTGASWSTDVWASDANRNNGYPHLINNDPGIDLIVEISNIDDLQNIANNPGGVFLQVADIDATSTSSWNSGAGFDPIDYFYGQYDGNGYTIGNLYINRPTEDYVAVFRDNRGIINNFKMYDSDITGKDYVSGLAAYNWGVLYRSKNYHVNSSASIVNGHDMIGGLVGYNNAVGVLRQSYAVADVSGPYETSTYVYYTVGGLVGNSRGTIENCYARGSVRGQSYYGSYIGGLVGNNGGNITNSFAAAVIDVPNVASSGFMGRYEGGTITGSFWDITVSGKTTSASGKGTGTTTAAMKTLSTFTNAGWDFDGSVWHMDPSGLKDDGYPYLNPPILPTIEIANITDLQNIANNTSANYLQTANIDASATSGWNSGAGFLPIDIFTGTYNGNGYSISNLTINRPSTDYVGIFGQNRGVINNLKINDSSITGRDYVGSVTGYNWGTVYRSKTSSSTTSINNVTGRNYVGGLVGYNNTVGVISESYALANVYGPYDASYAYYQVGGLVGNNRGTIVNSYVRGLVKAKSYYTSYVGGLVGNNGGGVNNSYAAATIDAPNVASSGLFGRYEGGTISNSFWDITASGKTSSAGGKGTGTTTAIMKTQTTFTNAGWNFSTVWRYDGYHNDGYMFLLNDAAGFVDPYNIFIFNYTGQGHVTVNGSTYVSPLSFASGTSITLVPVADSGWHFSNWEDDSTSTSRTLDMSSDTTVSAVFTENPSAPTTHNLTIGIVGQGQVTANGSTYTVPTDLVAGSVVSLVAIPNTGWFFASWDDSSTSTARTVTMSTDRNLTATFTEDPIVSVNYALTINKTGQGHVTVNGSTYVSPLSFASGTSITLVPVADSGWHFSNWEDDSTSTSRTFAIINNQTLSVYFVANSSSSSSTTSDNSSNLASSLVITKPLVISKPVISGSKVFFEVKNVINMAFSYNKDFSLSNWVDYNSEYLLPINHTGNLYIKFRSPDGGESDVYLVSFSGNSSDSLTKKFANNLKSGNVSNDVRELQKFLNANGFIVAKSGPGSPGQETTKFGAATRAAVIKFQQAKGIKPANGIVSGNTLIKINEILAGEVTTDTVVGRFIFTKDLKSGNVSNDVRELQKFLNANGFIVAKSGPGSPGQETTKFGAATRAAVIKFQQAKGIKPVNGIFGPLTRTRANE